MTPQEISIGGLKKFGCISKRMSKYLKMEYKEVDFDFDEDQITIEVNGMSFTLSYYPSKTELIVYQLCVWHTNPGNYHHPPESVDTTLLDSKSIWECARKLFDTVFSNEIRLASEAVWQEMAEEEDKANELV